jgi:selenide,water dikinase
MDFFTPVVDSPRDFGRIAAANALSDIYAMGAEPLFALNIVGFPTKELPLEVLEEILRGGAAVAAEAGVSVLGGHSADFDVPIYGMAVTGRTKASRIRRNSGARPGDALVLTKGLGTGILTAALRARVLAGPVRRLLARGDAPLPEEEEAAIASMTRLNRDASRIASRFDVSAGTDVTGYGLLGHLREMLGETGLAAEVSAGSVPLLPGARRLAEAGLAPAGTRRNLEELRPRLRADGVTEPELLLLADAQTSGGLLLAVGESESEPLVAACRETGDAAAARIGRILPAGAEPGGTIRIGS